MKNYKFVPGVYDGGLLVENEDFKPNEKHIIYYPTNWPSKDKEFTEWYFYVYIDNNDDGALDRPEWNLTEEEKEEFKEYIRKEIKPIDLCEERGTNMENKNLNNRLVLIIPEEKHNYIREVISAVINNEDEFDIDDMLVDEYEAAIRQRDEAEATLKEALKEIERLRTVEPLDTTPNNLEVEQLKAQLLQCKRDKDILAYERNKYRDELKSVLNKAICELSIRELLNYGL